MQLWPVAHFFFILSSLLGGFAVALLLHPPKSDDKMKKKWATGQSCIHKEVTSYKIHTLVTMPKSKNSGKVKLGRCQAFEDARVLYL